MPPIGAPSNTIASGRARNRPAMLLQQRALAGAVGADHRDGFAVADFHRDAEQGLDIAVERIERRTASSGVAGIFGRQASASIPI